MKYVASALAIAAGACSGPARTQGTGPGGGAGDLGADGPVVIDRFSRAAGHLMIRDDNNGLPAAGAPIDLDRPPFVTQGLGPDGSVVRYYNFDIQPDVPATLYRLTRPGERTAIADVVDVIPGAAGYSDFWRVSWVEVPDGTRVEDLTSAAAIRAAGLAGVDDARILDCPIVPDGTTAREGAGVDRPSPHPIWYRGTKLTCLLFETELTPVDGKVPTSPIYVTFATEPASGFQREGDTPQTHNVVMSLPGDVDYSPLWAVKIYDVAAFDRVRDATTALAAPLVEDGPLVNCPIVAIAPR